VLNRISTLTIIVLAIGALATPPTASAQTTWYVDDDAPNDPGPGDPTVSDPLEDGSPGHPFDAIQEGIDAAVDADTVLVLDGTYTGEGNKDLNYHGWAITVRSQNGPDMCIMDCEGDGRGFDFIHGEGSASVVDGFTVTGGYAPNGYAQGGAIRCQNASPTITNCVLQGNEAYTDGGGLSCYMSDAVISNCVIRYNRLSLHGECGGGVHFSSGNPSLVDCTIARNCARYYGGGVSCYDASPHIIGCVISRNIAGFAGGGIRCSHFSDPLITDCIISGNVARGEYDPSWAYGGGGMYCSASSPTVINCAITGNRATSSGGGIATFNWFGVSAPLIAHSIIVSNRADSGGGLQVNEGAPTVLNSIIRANVSGQVAGYIDDSLIAYCNIEGGWPGEGIVDVDPMFAFDDDWRILAGSPCIDAGTSNLPDGVPWEDIDGTPRPRDGNGDGVALPDIGLHEFVAESPAIAVSPSNLEFDIHEDDLLAPEQTLSIRNCGGTLLNWEIDAPCSWLCVSPESGISYGEIAQVTVSVDASAVTHETYQCDLTIRDPQASNSPCIVPLTLHVTATLNVPDEYPTIGAAMDAATVPHDVVLVADGTYAGAGNKQLNFRHKPITVRSDNGAESCVIDCEGDGRAFDFDSAEDESSVLEGFTITGGYAEVGGAIRCFGYSSPTIRDCTLIQNAAQRRGGAFFCRYEASPKILNCRISQNTAGTEGGGVYATVASRPVFVNTTIDRNTGNGVHAADESSPEFANCTIAANTGVGVVSWGGGRLENSIIWSNESAQLEDDEGLVTRHCNVQGGWPGDGNIDADPLFVDPTSGDYHLATGSPCIDAGDNTAVPLDIFDLDEDGDTDERTPFDLDGRLRFADRIAAPDTGNPDPNFPELPIVDMGAYEYQCTGDLDGSGQINLADLAQLLGSYGETAGMSYHDGDLDVDGDVDLADLAELLAAYGTVCE
jgi:hypothetical protein